MQLFLLPMELIVAFYVILEKTYFRLMKSIVYILLFLFSTAFVYGQENCNNGIDDDGDGKIDLNDTECVCGSSSVVSVIPNHSFEDIEYCAPPNGYGSATSWVYANFSRANYINLSCGLEFSEIFAAGLTPFPDGTGIYGENFTGNRKGYIGTCLLTPLIAVKIIN